MGGFMEMTEHIKVLENMIRARSWEPTEPIKKQVYNEERETLSYAIQVLKRLEELTPQGSEFHNDPMRCVDYVKGKINSLQDLVKSKVKEHKALIERIEDKKGLEKLIPEVFCDVFPLCKEVIGYTQSEQPRVYILKQERGKDLAQALQDYLKG